MMLFDRLFHKGNRRKDQRRELNYRIALAEMRRQASAMRREVDRCRDEACRLELSGDHAAAVSKAAEAANGEKAYQAAQSTLRRCESMHAQAKSQKLLTELMSACEAMSANVMDQIDTAAAMKAQTRLQQTTAAMEEAQEGMAAFQEGFEPSAEPAVRIAAGEEALAQIMAGRAVEAAPEEPAVEEEDAQSHAEWLAEKRRQLADIA